MKNKLISLAIVPFFLLPGISGYCGEPSVKGPRPPMNLRIKDCSKLLIDLYNTHESLSKLTDIERCAFEGLKRNPNNPLDESELKITQESKKKLMKTRDILSQEIKDYGCTNY